LIVPGRAGTERPALSAMRVSRESWPASLIDPPGDQRPGTADFFRDAGEMFSVEPERRFQLIPVNNQLPPVKSAGKPIMSESGNGHGSLAPWRIFFTEMPDSSCSSRTRACSRFSPCSTNPAIRPNIPGGPPGERAGRIRSSRCTSAMMAGDCRGTRQGRRYHPDSTARSSAGVLIPGAGIMTDSGTGTPAALHTGREGSQPEHTMSPFTGNY
jgi:hypothetical protein